MRTSAIVRIILFTLTALILISVFATLMSGHLALGMLSRLPALSIFHDDIPERSGYTAGDASVDAAKIDGIDVEWMDGSVTILPGTGSAISFSETYRGNLTSAEQMAWRIDGSTLKIEYEGRAWSFDFWNNGRNKQLTILIPADQYFRFIDVESVSAAVDLTGISADDLDISTVSGSVKTTDGICREADLETVSGSVTLANARIDRLDVSTVSGSMRLEGDFERLSHETVSGHTTLDLTAAPKSIEGSSTSGSVTLRLPENDGFEADLDSVSGKLACEFDTSTRNGRVIYKNGGGEYSFDSFSGSVHIERR